MSRSPVLLRPQLDPYIVVLLTTAVVASLLPARGVAVTGLFRATTLVIGLLFFLHGARLSLSIAPYPGGCVSLSGMLSQGWAPVSSVFPADEELHLLGARLQAIQLSPILHGPLSASLHTPSVSQMNMLYLDSA